MLLFSDGPYPRLCISLEVVLCEKCCCLVMDHIPGYVSPLGVVLCEKCCCLVMDHIPVTYLLRSCVV